MNHIHLSALTRNRKVLAHFQIIGEACSKANSRRLVVLKGRMIPIKSAKAVSYATAVRLQSPILRPLPEEELFMIMNLWYASERSDLDESLILDGLQGRCYANDRQVRERHIYHAIDRKNPRAEIIIGIRDPDPGLP